MSDEAPPVSLPLERLKRLGEAVADMMEAHTTMGRQIIAAMDRVERRLGAVEARVGGLEREVQALGAEQALLSNRVESAISRALRVNLRLDDLKGEGG
jgi:hypothetical protein